MSRTKAQQGGRTGGMFRTTGMGRAPAGSMWRRRTRGLTANSTACSITRPRSTSAVTATGSKTKSVPASSACPPAPWSRQRLKWEFETGAQTKSVLRSGISDRRELGSLRLALTPRTGWLLRREILGRYRAAQEASNNDLNSVGGPRWTRTTYLRVRPG